MATRVERSLHAIKQFNTTFHKTSSVTESRRASASSSSGDSWENGFICERLRDRIHGFEKHITNSPTGLMRRVYPKNDVYRVLTCKNIRSLLQCPCEGKWCRGRMSPATEQKITTIFSEYRLIFAILLEMERLCLIHSFVELGFTDESVLAHPLQQSELEQVMDDAYIRHGIRDNHFWKTFHHHKQYEFLLPNIPALEKADADDIFTVNISRTLPINLKRQLGRGGYGDVYQAELLDGYHSLETIDGCVAVKIFRVSSSSGSEKSRDYDDEDDYYTGAGDWDDQDCAAETRNNKRFQHSNIVPMLASLSHGPENMSFYPIARTSLQALISEPTLTPPNNTTVRIVEQVADLFSALNQIHTGNENGCGYHLDIKPANILVRADDSFALTDLGMAHFKTHQEVQQDRSFSETRMRPCSEEYAGPELTGKRIHRSFDIWAMGAVFLELLVWIAEGRDGVRKFHNARKTKKDYKIVASFHEDGAVKKEVLEKIRSLQKLQRSDAVFLGALNVVQLLLRPDEAERPTSREAEVLIRTLLDQDVVRAIPMTDFKQHVKSLVRDFRNANRKALIQPRKLSFRTYATFIQSAFRISQTPRQNGIVGFRGVVLGVGVAAAAMTWKSWK